MKKVVDPERYQDQYVWASTSIEYDDTSRQLTRWYEKWETAQEKLEEAGA